METHFQKELSALKEKLLTMGGLAEEMIHIAGLALLERRADDARKVFANEVEVNKLHVEIDDRCMKLIALHQPAAADLRLIMAALKINSDMERIGDQAVNICETTKILLGQPPLEKGLADIPRMITLAQSMLKDALDAFVKSDVELAKSVLKRDDEEDKLKSRMFQELLELMQSDSSTIHRALDLILISRNLERIADHATNIAEDVIFMALGKDIRHGAADQIIPPLV
jgi:phosphate transport system protein